MKILSLNKFLSAVLLIGLVLVFGGASQSKKKALSKSEAPVTGAIDADDYAVYSTVLTALYAKSSPKLFVIDREISGCVRSEKNVEGVLAWQKSLDTLPRKMANLSTITVADFKRKVQLCRKLNTEFSAPAKVILFEQQDRKTIFSGQNPQLAWQKFNQKFPGANGYINFSNVGFNADRSQALVDTYRKCGQKCGAEQIVLLTKVNGSWNIAAMHKVWEL